MQGGGYKVSQIRGRTDRSPTRPGARQRGFEAGRSTSKPEVRQPGGQAIRVKTDRRTGFINKDRQEDRLHEQRKKGGQTT